MLEKYYEEIKQNVNVRENLSLLRGLLKEEEARTRLLNLVGDGSFLVALLEHEEPKVRKNAALLLGDLGLQTAAGALFCAYEKEQTLFVRSSYLSALGKLDAAEYLAQLKACRDKLTGREIPLNERKHADEELRELEKIIAGIEGIRPHTFVGFEKEQKLLLTTNKEQRSVTVEETEALPEEVERSVREHPLGVLVCTRSVKPFTRLRTYRELLFPLSGHLTADPKQAAEAVCASGLPQLLEECHKEEAPFYFRIELKGRMDLKEKSVYTKRMAAELERLSGRRLRNSTQHYEVELRLVEKKDGGFAAFYKLFTIPMRRFAYRKHAIAASIHPALAAMLMQLAKPYLKEDARILDPFCGVGTMLIERDICVPAHEKYGVDIFGDAIRMARENAAAAGEQIYFINRDYFDFTHRHKFDEIITNMPVRSAARAGAKSKEEMDAFYQKFFDRSAGLLESGGMMILYGNEEGFVKKQLRLRDDYRLFREHVIRQKDGFRLFLIQYCP